VLQGKKKLDEVGQKLKVMFSGRTADLIEVMRLPTRQPARRSTFGVFPEEEPSYTQVIIRRTSEKKL